MRKALDPLALYKPGVVAYTGDPAHSTLKQRIPPTGGSPGLEGNPVFKQEQSSKGRAG